MCLAIPVRLEEIIDEFEGSVCWSGMKMRVGLALVSEARVGDYVLVHAGYAIQVIDPQEAAKTLKFFSEMEMTD